MNRGLHAVSLDAGYRTRAAIRTVVSSVTASVEPGEIVALLGVNGAGKSTLLRTLIGAQEPLAGDITLDGMDIATIGARERAQRLGVLLTDRVDVPLMKAEEIVALGRTPHQGWLSRLETRDIAIIERAMARAGATAFVGRQISELSDGERQRIMLARALAQEPEVLVLDEPLAFLDLVRRVELMDLLRRLADDGLGILLSIHDVELALRAADTVWIIQADGRFETGAPEDLASAGRIAAAFGSDRVRFSHEAGTFLGRERDSIGTAFVAVTGTEGIWAERALSRARYALVDTPTGADVALTLEDRQESRIWRLSTCDGTFQCPSLGAVVTRLRTIPS